MIFGVLSCQTAINPILLTPPTNLTIFRPQNDWLWISYQASQPQTGLQILAIERGTLAAQQLDGANDRDSRPRRDAASICSTTALSV